MNPYIQSQIESIYEEIRSLERQADKMRELDNLYGDLFKRIEPKARIRWITNHFYGQCLVGFNIYETGYDELMLYISRPSEISHKVGKINLFVALDNHELAIWKKDMGMQESAFLEWYKRSVI